MSAERFVLRQFLIAVGYGDPHTEGLTVDPDIAVLILLIGAAEHAVHLVHLGRVESNLFCQLSGYVVMIRRIS